MAGEVVKLPSIHRRNKAQGAIKHMKRWLESTGTAIVINMKKYNKRVTLILTLSLLLVYDYSARARVTWKEHA